MHHPLAGSASADEIRNYPLPRIAPEAQGNLDAQVRTIQAQGLATVGCMACTIWETAWYLRSMEDLMADMMNDEPSAILLLDRITDLACRRIEAYARAGTDLVMLGDDIGMQSTILMSVELWSTWIKPRLARVIAAGRAVKPDLLIFYHSCGYVLPFISHLIEIGVDILNPVQPECMPFAEVQKIAAGRLSYWGTIGTQTTLPFGTVSEVRAAVLDNLQACGSVGGIVIAPTHLVEPEVPWDNLTAMAAAANEFKP
jgi:uroporphyrinogen decarboxylase